MKQRKIPETVQDIIIKEYLSDLNRVGMPKIPNTIERLQVKT